MRKKKVLATMLMAGALVATPLSAFAANPELTDSTSSDFTTDPETLGEDVTQGKTYTTVSIDDIKDTTYSQTSQAEVYCTQASVFSVNIPKIITLDGQTKEGVYQVKVKGDISGNQKISVTTPATFTMGEQNATVNKKADVTATIYDEANGGAKTEWTQSEIKADTYVGTGTTIGKISAKDITAGSWKGTFDFSIDLTNDGATDTPETPATPATEPEA